jgi:hypothetical protein
MVRPHMENKQTHLLLITDCPAMCTAIIRGSIIRWIRKNLTNLSLRGSSLECYLVLVVNLLLHLGSYSTSSVSFMPISTGRSSKGELSLKPCHTKRIIKLRNLVMISRNCKELYSLYLWV